jgi:hypothetical protein
MNDSQTAVSACDSNDTWEYFKVWHGNSSFFVFLNNCRRSYDANHKQETIYTENITLLVNFYSESEFSI